MIQLNLLPDIKREYIHAQKVRNKVISGSILLMLGVLGALAILASYTYGVQQVHQRILDGQISDRAKELKSQPDIDKYLTLQNQLAALPELHTEKGSYSRLFDYLVRLNPAAPDNVSMSKLTLDSAGKTLSVEGFTNNYRSLNIFQKTLENAELVYRQDGAESREKLFSAIEMSQVGVGEMQGSNGDKRKVATFTAVLTFVDKAFAADIESPNVQIPNLNITNSISGTPQTFDIKPQEGN